MGRERWIRNWREEAGNLKSVLRVLDSIGRANVWLPFFAERRAVCVLKIDSQRSIAE